MEDPPPPIDVPLPPPEIAVDPSIEIAEREMERQLAEEEAAKALQAAPDVIQQS